MLQKAQISLIATVYCMCARVCVCVSLCTCMHVFPRNFQIELKKETNFSWNLNALNVPCVLWFPFCRTKRKVSLINVRNLRFYTNVAYFSNSYGKLSVVPFLRILSYMEICNSFRNHSFLSTLTQQQINISIRPRTSVRVILIHSSCSDYTC